MLEPIVTSEKLPSQYFSAEGSYLHKSRIDLTTILPDLAQKKDQGGYYGALSCFPRTAAHVFVRENITSRMNRGKVQEQGNEREGTELSHFSRLAFSMASIMNWCRVIVREKAFPFASLYNWVGILRINILSGLSAFFRSS